MFFNKEKLNEAEQKVELRGPECMRSRANFENKLKSKKAADGGGREGGGGRGREGEGGGGRGGGGGG